MRRRKTFSLGYKKKVLERYQNASKSQKSVIFHQEGLSKQSMHRWKAQNIATLPISKNKKKTQHRGPKHALPDDVENTIIQKVNHMRESMLPVSSMWLKTIAIQEAQARDITFRASDGWLNKFKMRRRLVTRKATKRKTIPQNLYQELEDFHRSIDTFIHQHHIQYVINIDETPLTWDLTGHYTLEKQGTPEVLIKAFQDSRKRITVVLGITYATCYAQTIDPAMKCLPMLIYKGKTARCVAGVGSTSLELVRFNSTAWCREQEWLDYLANALPKNCPPESTLIVVDGFSVHTTERVFQTMKEYGCFHQQSFQELREERASEMAC